MKKVFMNEVMFFDSYKPTHYLIDIQEHAIDVSRVDDKPFHDARGCYRYDFKVNNNGRMNKARKTRV